MKEIKINNRKAAHVYLKDFCLFAAENDCIEVTEWTNGEGYDIRIHVSNNYEDIQLTSGQFDAIKKLIKTLKKDEHTN